MIDEVKKQQFITYAKWGVIALAAAIAAPIALFASMGLIGIAIAAAIGIVGINAAPVLSLKMANWKYRSLDAEPRRASSGEMSHIVVKGDTLSTIAQATLGDKMRYGEIQQRNNLANPNFISVGQRLVIPK